MIRSSSLGRLPRAVRQFPAFAIAALATLAGPLTPALGQQPADGYVGGAQSLPTGTSLATVAPAGLLTFDGVQLQCTPNGQPTQTLLTLPTFRFGSFLLPVGSSHALLGVTGLTGGDAIWLVPVQGPAPSQPLAGLAFNYDAALLDPQHALVSARTGGFAAPDNELWVLDLATGATQLVASIPGASGPLAIGAAGDVYYATGFAGFPTPPGTCSVYRLPRPVVDAAIAGHAVLGIAHAQVVRSGLDAAADLAFDDDGDLLFVDWFNNRISEISDAEGGQPSLVPVVLDFGFGPLFPTSVQFLPGAQNGVFEPFQPANGALRVLATDYGSMVSLRSVSSNAADLLANVTTPAAAGPIPFIVSDAAPNGLGLLAIAAGNGGATGTLQVPGFEAPLAWSPTLLPDPIVVPFLVPANGFTTVTLSSPGFAVPLAAVAQVVFVSAQGGIGCTPPAPVLLGP